ESGDIARISRGSRRTADIRSKPRRSLRRPLLDTKTGHLVGDVGFDRLGCRDVGVAARGVAGLELRHAAAIERFGILRILRDRGAEVCFRPIECAELELNTTT